MLNLVPPIELSLLEINKDFQHMISQITTKADRLKQQKLSPHAVNHIEDKVNKNIAFENTLALASTKIDKSLAQKITAMTEVDLAEISSPDSILKKISDTKKGSILKLLD